MIKLIASDMDGTLLNGLQQISPKNVTAIQNAIEQGIDFVVVTGREYSSIKPMLQKHNLSCTCLLVNGAEVRDKKGTLMQEINLNKSKLKQAINILEKYQFNIDYMTDRGNYAYGTPELAFPNMVRRMQCFREGITEEEAIREAKKLEFFIHLNYFQDFEIFLNSEVQIRKAIVYHEDISLIEKAKQEIENIEGLSALSSFKYNIEITDIKAQKGYILEKVIQKMGIKKEEVMVFGDSFNDLTLFTQFPNSYAPSNAMPEIKKLAKEVVESNEADGVGNTILKMLKG